MFQKPIAVVLGAAVLATGAYFSGASNSPDVVPALAEPVALDQFAGKTVKNVAMGLEVMRQREANAPQVGTLAPDFELFQKDGESMIRLSDLRGGKPVVLVFGSYT